jgi:hypothetical protein
MTGIASITLADSVIQAQVTLHVVTTTQAALITTAGPAV